MNGGGFNVDANNGQITTNSDYTANTESLAGKPSSYFQNNNTGNTFGTNPSYGTTPMTQNQTITPWAGGYDLSAPTQSNDIQSIDYSRYGEGFSKEFIDKMENDKEFKKY